MLYHTSKLHKSDKPWKCRFCSRKYNKPETLFEHYQIHHQRGTFACSICCCLIGNLRNDILEHIREKHSFSICDNSQVNLAQPKVMQSEKTLNLNEHHTEATLFSTKVVPEIVNCTVERCSRRFYLENSQFDLLQHLEKEHFKLKFQCLFDKCHRSYNLE